MQQRKFSSVTVEDIVNASLFKRLRLKAEAVKMFEVLLVMIMFFRKQLHILYLRATTVPSRFAIPSASVQLPKYGLNLTNPASLVSLIASFTALKRCLRGTIAIPGRRCGRRKRYARCIMHVSGVPGTWRYYNERPVGGAQLCV